MSKPSADAADSRGPVLLRLARGAIAARLRPGAGEDAQWSPSAPDLEWLRLPGATFVSIHIAGALRGCIGSIEPIRTLIEDVRWNAVSAAVFDPRFSPMTADELDRASLEVSLLGPLEPIEAPTEDAAIAKVRPGEDGLLLTWQGHHGTLLPQVWKGLPEPRRFLEALRQKAGMRKDEWPPDIDLRRYSVTAWSEEALNE